jgi:formate hydrogenlyase transcriptional activator
VRVSGACDYPWSTEKVFRGEEVRFSSPDEIPDPVERENVHRLGTEARVMFPLSIEGRISGAIFFASARPRSWPPLVLDGLRLLAQVFGSALSRRQVETVLRASEQRFRALADNAAAMIWVSGPDKRGTWFNRRWLEFVGCQIEREVGDGWTGHIHPEDVEGWQRSYADSFDARRPFSKEYRLRRHDGEWRWVLDSASPNFGTDGGFAGYLGSCIDITEQKQAVEEVERLREKLHAENLYLRREVADRLGTGVIVGQSDAIQRVLSQIEQVAQTDSTVLLLGETGTGKELFATRIHELSARRGRAMVRVNCAAIPTTLIESELFGREKGAFTGALARQVGRFELADHSSIFLDEIGDLPHEVQIKMLRVLEERQVERLGSPKPIRVDVRIIAATHRNLEQRTVDGSFREDLFYRLNVFPIRVPPLRERVEDIPLLVWRFVEEFSQAFGRRIEAISRENMAALQRHAWPGNVRELRNVVERAMIVANGPRVDIELPGPPVRAEAGSTRLADVERAHIRAVLESTRWRIRGAGGAAERLGLRPTTLETRMAKLGLVRPRVTGREPSA